VTAKHLVGISGQADQDLLESGATGKSVNRLAQSAKKRNIHVRILSDCQCLCTTMYRIDPQHLLWVLDNLAEGQAVNAVRVAPETRQGSLLSLERMLQITAQATTTAPAG